MLMNKRELIAKIRGLEIIIEQGLLTEGEMPMAKQELLMTYRTLSQLLMDDWSDNSGQEAA